ncbi:hypothetical protein METBIDRAFT_39886 [Metschnikowia bicuspidata var. bicuspidata NRRL YB-4993]|uniref:MFS general substrate transporter n=1 Tax=Metschnikowia bicuspidata var. bicuspidata NRRL YB-4993 TaxID=869754 RepID=A0A1A0HD22_9ASCO|nr:hypothetical protein METBIDRAFT_39886 [Metschnikowia bicuspidata var. bicuspidata NRRL YB-4993]OBA21777.1 hypothetical protein METBIDRAFT_39886 [Metschnikowia bicuspidata var. bicuspidata NRRL YB-4993]
MTIDYSTVPGTAHLVDIDEKSKEIVLIPTPSDDPNDPLNWSKSRKNLHMFCVVLYVFATGIPGTCIYSILTDIAAADDIDISVADLNAGTGYAFLFLGLGCLISQPLAMQYGKRPVYLFSTLSCALLNLWQPYIKTNGVWIISKILAGTVTAPIEALPEATISDMFFEHERATYMGIYACALFGSNYIAPLVAGFINENSQNLEVGGWRWVIFWSVIFCAISFVFLFFFMEETNYERKLRVKKGIDGQFLSVITSHGTINHTKGGEKQVVSVQVATENASEDEIDSENHENTLGNLSEFVDANESVNYAPPKTFAQRLSLTSGVKSKFLLWEYSKTPFIMCQFPVVLWSGFLYGASLFWYTVLNATEALVLSSSPYNFSSSMTGLAYLSPCIFVVLIYFYAGWTTDYLKIKIAKRRGGLSQAEDRLWALSVYAILGPCALILWGVGAYHGIHWFGVVCGLGLMAGLCIIGCVNSVTYVIDCYHEVSCEAMATVIVIRNTMSFAMSYGITPWIENEGLQNTFIAAAFICLFCIGTFVVMLKTGYYWRDKTKHKYWRLIEHRRSLGMSH